MHINFQSPLPRLFKGGVDTIRGMPQSGPLLGLNSAERSLYANVSLCISSSRIAAGYDVFGYLYAMFLVPIIDVKNVFYVFNVFYFAQRFLFFKKTCIENPIKGFVKHFWDHRNKLIDHSDVVYLVSPNILNKKFC